MPRPEEDSPEPLEVVEVGEMEPRVTEEEEDKDWKYGKKD